MGFEHFKSTPLHPPSNGMCERAMGPINKTIRCAKIDGTNWKMTMIIVQTMILN